MGGRKRDIIHFYKAIRRSIAHVFNKQKLVIDFTKRVYSLLTIMHMESYSTLCLIKEMQVKASVRYHFVPTRIAINKNAKMLDGMSSNWNSHSLVGSSIKQ